MPIGGALAERPAMGVEGGGEAAEVGEVLRQRPLAVDGEVRERAIGGELLDERRGRGLVSGAGLPRSTSGGWRPSAS